MSEILTTLKHVRVVLRQPGRVFICRASDAAKIAGFITNMQRHNFCNALYAEMDCQLSDLLLTGKGSNEGKRRAVETGMAYLVELLRARGDIPMHMQPSSEPSYTAFRDAWLDEWQTKLQGEQR